MSRLHSGGGTPTILPVELIDRAKFAARQATGMMRASIGTQGFFPWFKGQLGASSPVLLRAARVRSLNTDLAHGLPLQIDARMADPVRQVLDLDPDRIAYFGYAHVHHMSMRQQLIDEAAIPGDEAHCHLVHMARDMRGSAGDVAICIDISRVGGA